MKSTVEELGSQTRFSVFKDQTAFTNAQFVSFPYCNMSTGKILALAVNQLLLLRRYQNICLTSLPISSRACALCERARQSFTMCLFSTVLLFYFHKRYLQLTRLDDWADISLEAFGVTSQRVVSHAASCETSLVLGECLYEEGTGTRQPHTHHSDLRGELHPCEFQPILITNLPNIDEIKHSTCLCFVCFQKRQECKYFLVRLQCRQQLKHF